MSAVLSAIGRYLKMAPYRHGGAGRGAALLPVSNRESDGHCESEVDRDGDRESEVDRDSDAGDLESD